MDIPFSGDVSAKLQSWKVKEGFYLPVGHVIFTYVELDEKGQGSGTGMKRFKSPYAGVIKKIHVPNGSTMSKGTVLLTLGSGPCPHPTVMKDMCAECGMDLRKLDEPSAPSASVSMIHSVPDLRVSMEQAQIIGKGDEERLLKSKKLVLLVDLDQTIIHTTNDNVPQNLKDVFHFQLWGHGSMWYHTRLRPKTREFLDSIGKLYELHICTFGTRSYAHTIARHLDPEGKYFSDRILSRDECFSQNSKTANLKELFPRGDHMVCIIDDREDVWNFAPNLIHVKPYHFFRHTGDINAPPGLTKQDEDDKTGFSFSKDGTCLDGKTETDCAETKEESKSQDKSTGESDPSLNINTESVNTACKPTVPSNKEDDCETKSPSAGTLREVKSDLSLSDEEDSGLSDKSEEEANEGDKEEESGEDEMAISKTVTGKSSTEQSQTGAVINFNPPSKEPSQDPLDSNSAEKSTLITTETTDVESSAISHQPMEEVTTDGESSAISQQPMEEVTTDLKENDLTKKSDGFIEVEDHDDYLLYLEHILKSIHEAFYALHKDNITHGDYKVPDVKNVIPYVRKKVLQNVSIVFSGVIPQEVPVSEKKNTRAYSAAMSLGAHISEKIIPPNKPASSNDIVTTHLVAARLGTAKVNEARRYKGIHVVSPDWLWCSAERWEHVDERLFPLLKKSHQKGNSPSSANNRKKDRMDTYGAVARNGQIPGSRKERTPSGRFMDTINPLLSFSMDEIESMGHEVDDICNESESSSSEDDDAFIDKPLKRRSSRSRSQELISELDQSVSELTKDSSSNSDSNSEIDLETGERIGCKKRKRLNRTETETEDEPLNSKFRRGEALPNEVDYCNLMNATSDDEATNDQDEEWMAQALEREFLDESSQD